jgi:kumamolisin
MWAGAMALVEQKAAQAGIDELGFLNPLFYQIAASTPGAFNDVIRGGNLLDVSGPGWDYATGLGSPNVAVLGDAIIEAVGP